MKKKNNRLKTVKVCVKCFRVIPFRAKQCPYCGGILITKTIIKKQIHHRMPNGKEVYT